MTSAYEATWVGPAEGQRRTLRILANGEAHPTAADTLDRYGVKISSTVVRATQALRDHALLTAKDPTRIADPFFAAWIRTRTASPSAARDGR